MPRKELVNLEEIINDEKLLKEYLKVGALNKSVLDNAPFAIIRVCEKNGEFEVIYANDFVLRQTKNRSLKDVMEFIDKKTGLGKNIIDLEKEDVKNLNVGLNNVGDTNQAEARFISNDGNIFWMRCLSTLVLKKNRKKVYQQIVFDITQEKNKDLYNDLILKANYLDKIFSVVSENTNDAYILFSIEDLTVEYTSPNIERLTGVKSSDLFTIGIKMLKPAELSDSEAKSLIDKIKFTNKISAERVRYHKVTNEKRLFRDSIYLTILAEHPKALLILSDITEERKKSEALRLAIENAQAASKAKSEFLSNMSHDIRTPMTAIMGVLSLIQSEATFTEKGEELFSKLAFSCQSMLGILNNVLDMSRIENGKVVIHNDKFNVRAIQDEITAIFRLTALSKKISLTSDISLPYSEYIGDQVAIKKVINNIVANSMKYTNYGGVHISVKSLGMNDDGYDIIKFTCEDTGIGMSEEFIKKIYEPFERESDTKINSSSGTGLGMAITKSIVEMLNGTIEIKSWKNLGTTVEIIIPLKPIIENSKKSDLESNYDIKGLNLLIVEDNDINSQILKALFEREGVNFVHASNGLEALNIFKQSKPKTFDVILMDVQMPVMNGLEATRKIRESRHKDSLIIPIIAMTANAFEEDIKESLKAGMDAHTSKPVNMNEIKKLIRKLVKK